MPSSVVLYGKTAVAHSSF